MSAFELLNRIQVLNANPNIDKSYGPYLSKQAAYDTITNNGETPSLIELGKTVAIIEEGTINEYWWKNGLTVDDLVPKFSDTLKTYITSQTFEYNGIDPNVITIEGSDDIELNVTVDNLPDNIYNIMLFVGGEIKELNKDYEVLPEDRIRVFNPPLGVTISVYWFIGEAVYENRLPSRNREVKIVSKSTHSIEIEWLSGGANANQGTPDSYLIYYSRTPFDQETYLNNDYFKFVPKLPYLAGETVSYTLSGLEPNTIYYIGVISERTNSFNILKRSVLSNVVEDKTSNTFAIKPNLTKVIYNSEDIIYYHRQYDIHHGAGDYTKPLPNIEDYLNDGNPTWVSVGNTIELKDADESLYEQDDTNHPLGQYTKLTQPSASKWDFYNMLPHIFVIRLREDYVISSINVYFQNTLSNEGFDYGVNIKVSFDGVNYESIVEDLNVTSSTMKTWRTFDVPSSLEEFKFLKFEFDSIQIRELVLLGSPKTNILPKGSKVLNTSPSFEFRNTVGSNVFINDDIKTIMKFGGQHRLYNNWNWFVPDGSPWNPILGINHDSDPNITIHPSLKDNAKVIQYMFESQRVTGSIDETLQQFKDIQVAEYGLDANDAMTFYDIKSCLQFQYHDFIDGGTISGYNSSNKPLDYIIYPNYKDKDNNTISLLKQYTNPKDSNQEVRDVPNGEDPVIYRFIAHAAFMFAMRYGSKGLDTFTQEIKNQVTLNLFDNTTEANIAGVTPTVETLKAGLNLIKYLQIGNEPDATWWGEHGYHSPQELAALYSAVYDGHKGKLAETHIHTSYGAELPIYGMKTADPDIKFVMGGLSFIEPDYMRQMIIWWDNHRGVGDYPLDVISVHDYHNTVGSQGGDPNRKGVSPDITVYGRTLYDRAKQIVDFRNKYMPDCEVWLSEYGYDEATVSTQSPLLTNFEMPTSVQGPVANSSLTYNDVSSIYQTWDDVVADKNFTTVTNETLIQRYFAKKVKGWWILKSTLHFIAAGINRTHHYMYRNVIPTIEDQTNGYTAPYRSSGYIDVNQTRGNAGFRNAEDLRGVAGAPNNLADGTGPTGLPVDFYPVYQGVGNSGMLSIQDVPYGGLNVFERANEVAGSTAQKPGKWYYPTAAFYYMLAAKNILLDQKFSHVVHLFDKSEILEENFYTFISPEVDGKVICYAFSNGVDSTLVMWLKDPSTPVDENGIATDPYSGTINIKVSETSVTYFKIDNYYEEMVENPTGEVINSTIDANSIRNIELPINNIPMFVKTNRIGTRKIKPVKLRARSVGSESIYLYWEDENDEELSIKVFIKNLTLNDENFTLNFSGSSALEYTILNLNENSTYEVMVQLEDGVGNSSPSSNVVKVKTDVKLPAPSNVRSGTIKADRVQLLWDYAPENLGLISGFKIQRSTPPDTNFVDIGELDSDFEGSYSFVDDGSNLPAGRLSENTQYNYKVFAVSTLSSSDASNVVGLTTLDSNLTSPVFQDAYADYFGNKVHVSFDQSIVINDIQGLKNNLSVMQAGVGINIIGLESSESNMGFSIELENKLDKKVNAIENVTVSYQGFDSNLPTPYVENAFGIQLNNFTDETVINRSQDETLLLNTFNFYFSDGEVIGSDLTYDIENDVALTEHWNPIGDAIDKGVVAGHKKKNTFFYDSGIKNAEGLDRDIKLLIPGIVSTSGVNYHSGIASGTSTFLIPYVSSGDTYTADYLKLTNNNKYDKDDGYFPNLLKVKSIKTGQYDSTKDRNAIVFYNLDNTKEYRILMFASEHTEPPVGTEYEMDVYVNNQLYYEDFNFANNNTTVFDIGNIKPSTNLMPIENGLYGHVNSASGPDFDKMSVRLIMGSGGKTTGYQKPGYINMHDDDFKLQFGDDTLNSGYNIVLDVRTKEKANDQSRTSINAFILQEIQPITVNDI